MKSVNFAESNGTLKPGKDMTGVVALNIHRGDGEVVSCWELEEDDLRNICRNKRIWLRVLGEGSPPVKLQTECPWE